MSFQKYNARVNAQQANADEVIRVCVAPQFDGGQLISDQSARVDNVAQALSDSHLFESLGDERLRIQSATAWGSSLCEYNRVHGEMPRAEILSNAAETVLAMNSNAGESCKMFESTSLRGANTETSQGVIVAAQTSAIVLPSLLTSATSDAATFVAGGTDRSEVYQVHRIAGANLGDVSKGEEIGEGFDKQYTSMKQTYSSPAQPDGTKERYIAYIYNEASPLTAADAITGVIQNQNPKIGMVKTSLRLVLNGRPIASDISGKGLFGRFDYEGKAYTVTEDSNMDYGSGIFAFCISPALPAKAGQLGLQFDLDVENNGSAFPTVTFDMDSYELRPHASVLAGGETIQSFFTMQRAHNLDLRSMRTATMRNLVAHETDMQNLRDMLIASMHKDTLCVPLQVAAGAYFKEVYEELHQVLLLVSQSFMNDTKVGGLAGLYCGVKACAAIKALGAPFFIAAQGYRQVPRVHFCGTLWGFKVFEVPNEINVAGAKLESNEVLAYARGENFSQAGLVAGNAIPTTLYRHGVDKNLFNRDTVWKLAYGDINPYGGEKFFRKLKFTLNSK